jgi:hypothetical protein
MARDLRTRGYGSGGLFLRGRLWWMHYSRDGRVIRQSTGCTNRREAELVLDTAIGIPNSGSRAPAIGQTWRLTVDEMRALRGPVVYVLQCNGRTLYVGASAHGLCRPLAASHHILGRITFTGDEDLIVHSCASHAEAQALEATLIAKLQPALNRQMRRVWLRRLLLKSTDQELST